MRGEGAVTENEIGERLLGCALNVKMLKDGICRLANGL